MPFPIKTRATRLAFAIVAAATAAALFAGCAPTSTHVASAPSASASPAPTARRTPKPTTPAGPAPVGISAIATGASVQVYDAPGGHVTETLANPISTGAPLTFLLAQNQGSWLKVDLAQRPNGSTGWIQASAVTLHSLYYSLHVSTETNTMTLSNAGTIIRTFSVATGTGGTPTPHGSFYVTELLAPSNSGYGPYAFGLSAFSTVLNSFGGGPGQIGMHGTDDVSSIGRSASHGCVRLHNEDITELAKMLPLDTPITID